MPCCAPWLRSMRFPRGPRHASKGENRAGALFGRDHHVMAGYLPRDGSRLRQVVGCCSSGHLPTGPHPAEMTPTLLTALVGR
jgi:hypothetical protein